MVLGHEGAGVVVETGERVSVVRPGDGSGVVLRRQFRAGTPRSEPLTRLESRIAGIGTADLDDRTLVGVATEDGTFRIWDAVTSEPHAELHIGADMAVRRADLGVLDGRPVALTIADDRSGDCESPTLTLWDVSAGEPLYEPMTVPEECEVGTLTMLDGRLAVIHGIDAGENHHPEQATDVQVIDVATRRVLGRHRHKRGWSYHATIARSAGGTVVLVAAENWVAVMNPYDMGGPDIEEFEYAGHNAFVDCVATADVAGRTIVASCDRGNDVQFWDLDTQERLRPL